MAERSILGFPFLRMPQKRVLLTYQDKSKKYIGCDERDRLLLDGLIEPAENGYAYIGQPRTFHSFADLGQIKQNLEQKPQGKIRHYLAGKFTVVMGDKRTPERLETVDGMVIRLKGILQAQI